MVSTGPRVIRVINLMPPSPSTTPLTHPAADVGNCRLGAYCEIGARPRLLEVTLGDHSYIANDSDATCATIGRFRSIAATTPINPGNHPMQRARQSHFTYRASAYFAREPGAAEFFVWREPVASGHDVWIGRGAIVLPRRRIGTGAVIAAGTAGSKELAPTTIVAGNRARPIGVARSACSGLPGRNRSHKQPRCVLTDFRKLPAELERY